MKLFSLVIPCYNEGPNIPVLFEKLGNVCHDSEIEVIFVNNGSNDDSKNIFDEFILRYSFARIVNVYPNQGYGFGILSGLKEAQGEFVGWTHADLQTDPSDPIRGFKTLAEVDQKATFLKGLRRNRPFSDQAFTWGMSLFESLLFGFRLWDINAQPTLFHRSLMDTWVNPPYDFSLDLYVYLQACRQGFSIMRMPVVFPPRKFGTSHWNTGFWAKWKFIRRTIDFSLKLRKEIRFS